MLPTFEVDKNGLAKLLERRGGLPRSKRKGYVHVLTKEDVLAMGRAYLEDIRLRSSEIFKLALEKASDGTPFNANIASGIAEATRGAFEAAMKKAVIAMLENKNG